MASSIIPKPLDSDLLKRLYIHDAETVTADDISNALGIALRRVYNSGTVNATREVAGTTFLYNNEPYFCFCIGKGSMIYFICFTWNKIYNGWWQYNETVVRDLREI